VENHHSLLEVSLKKEKKREVDAGVTEEAISLV
jgi:hypothetical protein